MERVDATATNKRGMNPLLFFRAFIAFSLGLVVHCDVSVEGVHPHGEGAKVHKERKVCDIAVVGAGVGGAYVAWQASAAGKSVCMYEMNDRPGGRIHSLRKMGPKKDLVVEAGAYRFTTTKICHEGIPGKCVNTPITRAVVKELGLPTKVYDPNPKMWDHEMRKIVDADGHDAGYLTLPETLLERSVANGATIMYSAKVLQILPSRSGSQDMVLRVAASADGITNFIDVVAHAVLFNIPQRPLLDILRNSGPPFSAMFSAPLHRPTTSEVMKLYVHYEDAWWRNDLGLKAGDFKNNNPSEDGEFQEEPAPLAGRYHDGDIRCDLPGKRCRGYLQAYYAADAVQYYRPFHPLTGEAAVELLPQKEEHRQLLLRLHRALVEFHRKALDAANATERVSKLVPTSAVLSIWSETVAGMNAGCHWHNLSTNINFTSKALQPFPGFPIFVANEAFGPYACWAEGSLNMSHLVLLKLLGKDQIWNMDVSSWEPHQEDLMLVSV